MYVVATVDAGTIRNAIAVPDAAVLRDSENQPFVYVGSRKQSVWEALRHARGEHQGTDTNYHWAETRRSSDRRWQLVPAVCELAAALAARHRSRLPNHDKDNGVHAE